MPELSPGIFRCFSNNLCHLFTANVRPRTSIRKSQELILTCLLHIENMVFDWGNLYCW